MDARHLDAPPRGAPPTRLWLFGIALTVAMVALAWVDVRADTRAWLALASAASVIYLAAVWTLGRSAPSTRRGLWVCLALAAACRLPLVMAPPTLSDDIYRYIWDGRVQRAGLSPYVSPPADPALAWLHTPATRLTNHPKLPTIYPPAAQWFFRGVASIGDSVFAFKAAFLLCDLLLVGLLLTWLSVAGHSPWGVLIYAWNPLVMLEVAGSGHVDGLGAMLLFASFLALGTRRTMLAALAFVAAVGVKFLPVVLVPLLWRRIRVRDAVVAGLFAIGLAAPFFGGLLAAPVGSLPTYLANWRFNGPAFALAERLVTSRWLPLLPALVGLAVAMRFRRRVASPAAWAWPMAASLFFMPAIFPWYLLWLTPFLIATSTWSLRVWTQTALLTYAAWLTFPATVRYQAPRWVIAIEYGGVVAAALWAVRRSRMPVRPPPCVPDGSRIE